MALGSLVRKSFGRHEHRVAQLYRGAFMDLRDYAGKIGDWAPKARRILEVGCGEGAVTEILAETYPDADILAIDIASSAGRLYRGRPNGVEFRQAPVLDIAAEYPASFDLITLSDVMHHIPLEFHAEILDAVRRCLAPGGRFVLKDWARTPSPIHWLCHAGDRWLTGDRVHYLTPLEAMTLVTSSVPDFMLVAQGHIGPWRNNYSLTFQC
jgi:2-polyprenyl-6-hydroxyphenyl methylase/3-demethylubiquinone-9 3-methyltransferase